MKTWLDACAWHRARRIADLLQPHLPPDARVLDIGSGTGHNAAELSARGMDVVATDVADLRVVGPPSIQCQDGRLPFAGDAFDVTLLLYVLQYSQDLAALLREAVRVAPRAVVLQSTYRGSIGRGYLALREFTTGRGALRVARAVGFVPARCSPLDRPRLLTRQALRTAAARTNIGCEDARPPSRLPVARDLLVLRRRA